MKHYGFAGRNFQFPGQGLAVGEDCDCGSGILHGIVVDIDCCRISLKSEKMDAQNQNTVWSELYRQGDFDSLVIKAMPVLVMNASATRWFLRVFAIGSYIFRLHPETVEQIKEYADDGNPYAQYAMGRILVFKQPNVGPDLPAKMYLEAASRSGLPEAMVAIAQALHYGDFGPMNWTLGHKYEQAAIDLGSEFGAQYFTQEIINGMHGLPQNPEQALQFCEMYIENGKEKYGESEVDPRWYYLKGCAEQTLYGWAHGGESFSIAADKGFIHAYIDYAISQSHNDEGVIVDRDAYDRWVKDGAEHGESTCINELATALWNTIGDVPEDEREAIFDEVVKLRYEAMRLGSGEAAEATGDMMTDGEIMSEAFQMYCKGVVFNNMSCCEKAYAMMVDGSVDYPSLLRDFVALRGARLGSQLLIEAVVTAYHEGRLQYYASEIEERYLPDTETGSQSDDDPDPDDLPDDDGRFDAYV